MDYDDVRSWHETHFDGNGDYCPIGRGIVCSFVVVVLSSEANAKVVMMIVECHVIAPFYLILST